MADQERLFAEVSRFAALLATLPPVDDVLRDLTGRTAAALGVRSSGTSLVREGRLRSVAALDTMATVLGRFQEREQCGPCVEALRTGRPVAVPDLARDAPRWPGYGEHILALGVASTASVPLHRRGQALGTLDLYHTAPRPWSAEDLRALGVLTDMTVGYLAQAGELAAQRRTVAQLQHALDSRVIIEQAKGMLAAERRISPTEAFELLRRYARDRGVKVRSTALSVVSEGLRP